MKKNKHTPPNKKEATKLAESQDSDIRLKVYKKKPTLSKTSAISRRYKRQHGNYFFFLSWKNGLF